MSPQKPSERKEARLKGKFPGEAADLPMYFAGLFGVFLGLSLLKFGNPVVMEKYLETPPADFLEWLINAWPPAWCYWAMGILAVIGAVLARWARSVPRLLAALPLAWLLWELIAGLGTANGSLTRWTLVHFACCAASFYLGLLVLGRLGNLRTFLGPLLAGGAITVLLGFEQHFGGLEQTRSTFRAYTPDPSRVMPEMINKILSDRIFSTLFYPDTLAGAILMLLPVALGVIWSLKNQLTLAARCLAAVLVAVPALACLYWTGSKGGWLLAIVLTIVSCGFLRIRMPFKLALASGILLLGLGGFALRHMEYVKKGAPSAVARIDFWEAAVKITAEHPILGSGPGTFGLAYQKYKKPDGESPRMTHNDYLEQASDSGLLGGVLYTAMIAGTLAWTWFNGRLASDPIRLGVWLGTLGWALHSLMEFHLYIPAMAWPAFALLGWLLAVTSKESTNIPHPG